MERHEYLEKMQQLRELQQSEAKKNTEILDALKDEYRKKKTQLLNEHEEKNRELRDARRKMQYEI